VRHSLTLVKPCGLPVMSATAQTDLQQGRYSHPGSPWYSPPLSANSGPDPLGGYCHPSHNGRQTGENACGLPLAFPPTDRSGPVRLFRRGNAGLDSRRPQRQKRGLELAAENKTGKLLLDYTERTPVGSLARTTQSLTHTTPCIFPMSWTS
jgi:hypothetical protein